MCQTKKVLSPFLRGRDVQRWKTQFGGSYLIRIPSSENIAHPCSGLSSIEAEQVFAQTYPEIYRHFQTSRDALIKRYDQGHYYWELRSCAYWGQFERPKIIYQVIATYQQFAYTDQPFVSNDKTWIIPAPPAGLLAYLNSKVAWFFLDQVAPKLQGGAFELRSPAMSQLPVPKLSKKLASLEKKALAVANTEDNDGLLVGIKDEIDREVVHLFNLSEEEEAVVDEVIEAAGNRFPKRFRESEEYKKYVSEMFGDE